MVSLTDSIVLNKKKSLRNFNQLKRAASHHSEIAVGLHQTLTLMNLIARFPECSVQQGTILMSAMQSDSN